MFNCITRTVTWMPPPKQVVLGFVQVDLLLLLSTMENHKSIAMRVIFCIFCCMSNPLEQILLPGWLGGSSEVVGNLNFPPQKNVKIHPMISLPNLTPKNHFCSAPCVYLLFGAPNLMVIIDAIHRFILLI